MALLEHPLSKVLIALAIGLLVGAERERRKDEGRDMAGIRTYGLAGLLGGLCAILAMPWLIAAGALFVAALTIAGYLRGSREDAGATSEIALVVTFVLGVLAVDRPGLASGAAVAMTAVLAMRTRMHSLVREALSQEELQDALILAVSAFVVLPLLPDAPFGPFGGIHLPTLWRLVVLMMALSGAGYVAQRLVGPRFGLPLAGLAGGFVSSSATIASMGGRAKADATLARTAAAGAACSTIATIVQLFLVVGAANRAVLARSALPLAAAGAAAVIYSLLISFRGPNHEGEKKEATGRAFKLSSALFFAALVGVVTLVAKVASARFGQAGMMVTVAVAAFADAHSAAASAAGASTDATAGTAGVLLALSTNSITKIVLAFTSGPRGFAFVVSTGVVVVLAAAWTTFALL